MRGLRTMAGAAVAALIALAPGAAAPPSRAAPVPQILAPEHHDLSQPASSAVGNLITPIGGGDADARDAAPPAPRSSAFAADPVAQTSTTGTTAPPPITSFDGMDSSAGGFPPDPNGAVGPYD